MSDLLPPSFYDLLGLTQHATPDEIRLGWRSTARKLHPDVAGEESTELFLQAREAYEVLSDPRRRRQYDIEQIAVRIRATSAASQAAAAAAYTKAPDQPPPAPREQAASPGPSTTASTHEPAEPDTDSDPEQTPPPAAPAPEHAPHHTRDHHGSTEMGRSGADLAATVTVSFVDAVFGTTVPLSYSRRMRCRSCNGLPPLDGCASCGLEGYELLEASVTVSVPPGTSANSSVTIFAAGDVGERAGPPGHRRGLLGASGDLVVNVNVIATPGVIMAGADLIYDLPLDVIDALLGCLVHPTLLDGSCSLAIPPGCPPGQRIKIPGRGVPIPGATRGDAYAELRIVMRQHLTADQRELLELLRLPE